MTSPSILVVDDEKHILEVVEFILQDNGYVVTTASTARAAFDRFEALEPDLVVLDLNLPGVNGLDLLRRFRELRPAVPIVMLTAKSEEIDRIIGLEVGADDYVTKPFSPRELSARVKAVLRRTHGNLNETSDRNLSHGPIILDPISFTVRLKGKEIPLTIQEYRLLESLLRNPARVFTREMLIRRIHDGQQVITDRSIDSYVKRIRKKLPGLDPIQTIYGIGYKLAPLQ
jgi:DNA-binding response OmpR family regulator